MQFLIREFTDSTGYVHTHVEQPRENETLHIIEASSKEQALKVYKAQRQKEALMSIVKGYKKFKERLFND